MPRAGLQDRISARGRGRVSAEGPQSQRWEAKRAGPFPKGSTVLPAGTTRPLPLLFPGPLYPDQVSSGGQPSQSQAQLGATALLDPTVLKELRAHFSTPVELVLKQMAPFVSSSCIHVPCF